MFFPTLYKFYMKIIHSFWSKPFINVPFEQNDSYYGWRDKKYHYMSWALSCLSFKKVYGHIELYTDREGKEIFKDILQLPYDKIHVELDCLNTFDEKLWAIGKIYTYILQNKPFIHVDGDVFIWQRFDKSIEQAELFGQHLEINEGHYRFGLNQIKSKRFLIPSEFESDFQKIKKFQATNAGIIGGNNIKFFKNYGEKAFDFINKNLNKISNDLIGANYALLYEQYFFSVLARLNKIEITHFLDSKKEDIASLNSFERKYGNKKYVHLLGDSKMDFRRCRELEMQLIIEYPKYHERILNFLN